MCRLPVDDDMSGTVLVVTSGKGGVGKSTTALNLGVTLGIDGHSVALVDADLGMANLGTMLGVESDPTLHDVLAGDADIESAIVTESETLGVVPGGHTLEEYADADPGRLPAVLATLSEQYEYVVVDAAAGLGYADVVPIDAADEVVLVTTPGEVAVGDTSKLAEFSGMIGARLRGVVVTRTDEDVDAEAIAAKTGTELLGVVPEDPAVQESTDAGVPLERHAPDSPAAAAYRRLAGVISGGADVEDSDEVVGSTEEAAVEVASAVSPTTDGEPMGRDDPTVKTDPAREATAEEPSGESPTGGQSTGEAQPPGDERPPSDESTKTELSEQSSAVGERESEDAGSTDENGGGFFSRLRGLF